MDISGYILAGGKGSRIGGSKHEIIFQGLRLIDRALAIVRPVCVDVAVISKEPIDTDARNILDASPDGSSIEGPLVGLYSAFSDAAAEWSIILACDMPFVTPALIERLISFISDDLDAIIPVQPDGQRQPLCAIYRGKACIDAAVDQLRRGKRSPLAMADLVRTRNVPFEELSDLMNADRFFLNLNTAEDVAAAEKLLKSASVQKLK